MLVDDTFKARDFSLRVRVRVCLSVRDHIFGTTRPIFANFYERYLWPWLGPPLAAQ